MNPRDLLAEKIVVVLNETQDRVNIAGAIRAMMNTGLRRLRMVNPVEWDEYRIEGIAHGSEIVRERVEFFDTLEAALADAVEVVGTTARRRAMRHSWEHPRDGVEEILSLARDERGPVAILFGREDTGLTNEQLDRCDRIWTVPTDPERPSLNLAQAVLLVAYELWLAGPGSEKPLPRPRRDAPPATSAHLEEVFEEIDRHLHTINFYRGGKNPESVMRTIRAIMRRAGVDERETELVRAIAARSRRTIERLREE
ncbi:MAG: TrmJ/YjtD family RNA methyltransferase [Gemmatimonadetes bacterium]|nr:TrmJ/YjtD family RNA methyltransferase [Gemmatimonadota bacterium]